MNFKQNSSDILVSICCTAYNLEKYISLAIESFLIQQTNFHYEIIIGEDCSQDSTRDIIAEYCKLYPGLIQLVTSNKNVGIINNYARILQKAKGKYIAVCDGDDYWTDPLKLQKQVDFLESNSDYVICCHYSKVINEFGDIVRAAENLKPFSFSFNDVLIGKRTETRNSTMVIRNTIEFKKLTSEQWIFKCYAQDRFIKLYATYVSKKMIYVIPELMGCYRIHQAGTSQAGFKVLGPKNRSDFNLMVRNFNYPNKLKRELLLVYLRRFLFYDLKQLNVADALSTLKILI